MHLKVKTALLYQKRLNEPIFCLFRGKSHGLRLDRLAKIGILNISKILVIYSIKTLILTDFSMATSKSGGSTSNGRDSISKRLGVKLFDGQRVSGGEIIVRQRGSRFHPGRNVGMGSDDTIFAAAAGTLKFHYGPKGRRYISVI